MAAKVSFTVVIPQQSCTTSAYLQLSCNEAALKAASDLVARQPFPHVSHACSLACCSLCLVLLLPPPSGTLVATMFLLFHWAEQKRIGDFYKPGSQGDGSFFGITDDFKGTENGYPGAAQQA